MLTAEEQEIYTKGIKAVDNGDTATGLACFERLFEAYPDPIISSYYAVCLAKERGETERAMELCEAAMEDDPGVSLHHLNLGRVFLASGMKREAIKAFRNGLLYGRNPAISRELAQLGWRDLPVFPSLGREHLLNRVVGKLLNMFGLR
jgi:predicted Zn-dependent protease